VDEAAHSGGIRAEAISCTFGAVRVLETASLEVQPGRVTALVGPNGSGKSTLLRAMARLHRPAAGDVLFDDGSSALHLTAKAFARRVTLLTQSRPTPTGIAVRDVVAYGRHPHRRGWHGDDPRAAEAIDWAMEVTGVTAMAERGVDELSGGERQRVWLATCLCQQTSVLLLDEPTTYLDLRYQVEILDLIRDLADHHGVGVGVVLHDLQQATDVADRVVLLDAGRIVADGTPDDVMAPEDLTSTFGIRIDVCTDPNTGSLRIQPVGRHTNRTHQPA
jgi:iron complex transport system ATP-binding protein